MPQNVLRYRRFRRSVADQSATLFLGALAGSGWVDAAVRLMRPLRPVFNWQWSHWSWPEVETLYCTDHFARRNTEIERCGGGLVIIGGFPNILKAGDIVLGFSNGSVVISAYLNSYTPPPGARCEVPTIRRHIEP
jgi:hypothetical protein